MGWIQVNQDQHKKKLLVFKTLLSFKGMLNRESPLCIGGARVGQLCVDIRYAPMIVFGRQECGNRESSR